ncbi:MAG: oligosaccharide flippase family protein [Chloroflexi bacterium]|nr:oligosaccharide flippase family protein [Chloroflexota bacterium]MBU1748411.1 oligosaccharide flippase family protein [Chloroflexota bacterium]
MRDWIHRRRPDLLVALLFLILPALFLAPTLLGGRVLLPIDVLYTFEPWQSFAGQLGVTVPHNHLIGDMVIQNLSWKGFAQDVVWSRDVPLWNPYLFGGVPFLAAGQYQVLYPLGFFFYLLPIPWAYAPYTWLHLALAALFMYAYLRVIHVPRIGATLGGIAFMFCSFLVVSFVWPQIVGTAIWLPLCIAFVELVIRAAETPREQGTPPIVLYLILGGGAVGMQFLAGHMEISFYILFSMLFYAVCRLIALLWTTRTRSVRRFLTAGAALGLMVGLGFVLATVQIWPFFEAIRENFRAGYATYDQVISWALPWKRALSFVMPDFFGNPTHHSYFDVFAWRTVPLTTNALGEARAFVEWDPANLKNYVEGASYVGILPLLLALVALLWRRNRYTWTFAAYAVFSLLLAFGTPLYAIFFFGIPGADQLHTAFRWIYPWTFSACALAGIGAGWLTTRRAAMDHAHCSQPDDSSPEVPAPPRGYRPFAWAVFWAGVAVVAGLLISRFVLLDPTMSLVERAFAGSESLQQAFASPQMFYSYQFRNVLLMGLLLASSGIVLRVALCPIWLPRRRGRFTLRLTSVPAWQVAAIGVLVLDLFLFGVGFNTAGDPALLDFTPPAVAFLQQEPDLTRITTFGYDDVLKPNTAMRYRIQDMRGYDTIVPKQYVETWGLMEEPHGLLYSMIHKLVEPASLTSPILDLLGVRHALTTQDINLSGWTEVYRGEVNIYRNEDALPRAFLVPRVQPASSREEALTLLAAPDFDPRQVAIVEGLSLETASQGEVAYAPAKIVSYQPNEVIISATVPGPAVLILADSYFPGWRAYVDEQETPIYRADGCLRAVLLSGDAPHTVRFKYMPDSFRYGLYMSFIGAVLALLGAGYWAWRRFYRGMQEVGTVQRIAKNSLTPMIAQLFNKGVDTAFAMLLLRILGPTDAGKYAFAVVVFTYFDIFIGFGLNTLIIREVARDKTRGPRFLANTLLLRAGLLVLVAPAALVLIGPLAGPMNITPDTGWAIVLLLVGLVPGSISAALTALFQGHELMEYPAAVTVVSNVLRAALGAVALFAGLGIIGLAGVSIVINLVTLAILWRLAVVMLFRPRAQFDAGAARWMANESYPLMLNDMLSRVFFRVDVLLMKPILGAGSDTAVGYYTTPYKYLDGLNIVPSTFTLAIFPLFSSYADSARERLNHAYHLALKFLLLMAIPLTILTVYAARDLILILGGPQYVPGSVTVLQVLIWFLPFSFINSVTHYVLIAVGQQRFLTLAFVIGAAFNITANLIAIPLYGIMGAAVVTILSEWVLLAPFYYGIRKHVGPVPWLHLTWRPVAATAVMGLVLFPLREQSFLITMPLGLVIYGALLLLLRTFTAEDRDVVRRLVKRG